MDGRMDGWTDGSWTAIIIPSRNVFEDNAVKNKAKDKGKNKAKAFRGQEGE